MKLAEELPSPAATTRFRWLRGPTACRGLAVGLVLQLIGLAGFVAVLLELTRVVPPGGWHTGWGRSVSASRDWVLAALVAAVLALFGIVLVAAASAATSLLRVPDRKIGWSRSVALRTAAIGSLGAVLFDAIFLEGVAKWWFWGNSSGVHHYASNEQVELVVVTSVLLAGALVTIVFCWSVLIQAQLWRARFALHWVVPVLLVVVSAVAWIGVGRDRGTGYGYLLQRRSDLTPAPWPSIVQGFRPFALHQQPTTLDVDGVGCDAAGACLAVGRGTRAVFDDRAELVTSTDGGATWSARLFGVDGGFVRWLTCTADECRAVVETDKEALTLVTVRGNVVARQGAVHFPFDAGAFTCPTDRWCAAAGLNRTRHPTLLTSADGGVTWQSHAIRTAHPVYEEPGLACSQPGRCVVTLGVFTGTHSPQVELVATADGGASWHQGFVSTTALSPQALSCSVPSACVAVLSPLSGAPTVLISSDGGMHWTTYLSRVPWSTTHGLDAAYCYDPGDCWLAPSPGEFSSPRVMYQSHDAGLTWRRIGLPPGLEVGTTSCVSSARCVALGPGGLEVTADGGLHWRTEQVPAPALH